MAYQTSFMPRPQGVSNGRPATPVVPIERVIAKPLVVEPRPSASAEDDCRKAKPLAVTIAGIRAHKRAGGKVLRDQWGKDILASIALVADVPVKVMLDTKTRRHAKWRILAIRLIQRELGWANNRIGKFMGHADHTTALYVARKFGATPYQTKIDEKVKQTIVAYGLRSRRYTSEACAEYRISPVEFRNIVFAPSRFWPPRISNETAAEIIARYRPVVPNGVQVADETKVSHATVHRIWRGL